MLFVRAKIPKKNDPFYKGFQTPTGLCLQEAGCDPFPQIRTRTYILYTIILYILYIYYILVKSCQLTPDVVFLKPKHVDSPSISHHLSILVLNITSIAVKVVAGSLQSTVQSTQMND